MYCIIGILRVLLIVFLIILRVFLSEKLEGDPTREEITSYECGFEHNSLSRVPFSIRYFLLTVIFLIFDLEVVLLVFAPLVIIVSLTNIIILLLVTFFIYCLFLGLMYEALDGSLDWVM